MIDLTIVILFVLYSVTSGFRHRSRASQSPEDYFLAGRTLRGWQAGVSMAATQFAADTPLLVAGLIATGGIFLVWRLWIYGLAFLLLGFVFSVRWRRARVLTDAEFAELRYSGRGTLTLRTLKALYYGIVLNCSILAMVLVATLRISEVFLPWHNWLPAEIYQPFSHLLSSFNLSLGDSVTGLDKATFAANSVISILAIVSFTTLYSTMGGLRSVVATDVMQFSIAMLGTVCYAAWLIAGIGGFGALSLRLVEFYGEAQSRTLISLFPPPGDGLYALLIIISLQWIFQMNSDGTGYLAQRSMACRSDADARAAAVVFAWLQIVLRSVVWLIIGVSLLVLYPYTRDDAARETFAASRELLFVQGINDFLPAGIRGLMLVGLLAALASTVDTHLNWGASYLCNDLYKRLLCQACLCIEPGKRSVVAAARLSNILILGIALSIIPFLGSIQQAWYVSLLFGAGTGAVLVLRWVWERINVYSEIGAIAVSLLCAPLILSLTDSEPLRLGAMALLSSAAVVLITLLTPPTDSAVLGAFYQQASPSGFWSNTARALGLDGRLPLLRLFYELRTVCAFALSMYFMLAGLVRIFFPLPGNSPFWGALMLASSLALGTIALRLSRGENSSS